MQKVISAFCLVSISASLMSAPTANEDFVVAEDAKTYANAVKAANEAVRTNEVTLALVAAMNDLTAAVAGKASALNAAQTNAVNSGVTAAKVGAWDVHVDATNNPHCVKADQVGALPLSGGAMDYDAEITLPVGSRWRAEASPTITLDDSGVSLRSKAESDQPYYGIRGYSTDGPSLFTKYRCGDIYVFAPGPLWESILTFPLNRSGTIALTDDIPPPPGNYLEVSNAAMTARSYTDEATNATTVAARAYADTQVDAAKAYTDASIGEIDVGVTSVNGATGEVSISAVDVGAFGAAAGASLQTQVTTIGAHLNAEDARFVVTNYNSVTHTPEAYVEIKLPDNSWSRIWSEMTRWNWLTGTYLPGNFYTQTEIDGKLDEKADRAWGFYDSTTGAFAPDDYTWISSPKIAIAANLAYQRTVTAEGAIWVLESNGTVTETGGMTNGFFRISDDEGNSLFEIVKGNKRTVGADASSCQTVAGFTPTKLQIGYSIVSDVHPTIYVCNSLSTQAWKAEDDSDCVANVSWSGASGAWVAQVQGRSAYSSLFVKATYEVGGETYISNSAPVSMQYLMLGGVKYAVGTATISGHTVLTLTVAQR